MSTTDRDLNKLSSTVYIDMLEQEPQNHDLEESVQQSKLDEIMSFCDDEQTSWWKGESPPLQGTGNMTSSHSSACQRNSLVTGEAYWDNFSWSTGLTATGQKIESIADHCVQSPKCTKNAGTEDTAGNCISSAYGISSLLGVMEVCANASTAEPHEALQSAEITTVLQPNCASSESIQSSGALNDMEVANQDVYVNKKDEHETLNSAAVEGSTISCLSSETAVCGVEGLMKDCQVQTYQVEKKSLHLDELITGAVMAECQLHQKTFSHYDLEPLSRLLTAHVTSIYQKQKTNVIEFKDLVDACSGAPEITLQRYFVALLGAAHQHNMGNLKDIRMEGLQILLEEGISGRLSEVTINLSPCLQI